MCRCDAVGSPLPQTYAQHQMSHQINQYENKHTHAHTHADIPKYASTAASNLPAAASRWKRAVSFVAPVSSTNSATEVSDTSILTPPPQSALPLPSSPSPQPTHHASLGHDTHTRCRGSASVPCLLVACTSASVLPAASQPPPIAPPFPPFPPVASRRLISSVRVPDALGQRARAAS